MSISDSSKPDVEKMKLEKDVEGLIKALKYDGDWKVRWRVTSAFGKIGDPRAIEHLIQALKDEESDDTRRSAAWALGKIGDPRAVEPLIEALNDKDGEVQKAAKEALENIKAKKA